MAARIFARVLPFLLPLGTSSGAPRPTLLVSFMTDVASVTIADALRRHAGPWEAADASGALWRAARPLGAPPVFLWQLEVRPVDADHIDAQFTALSNGPSPAEVLFLSRHVSSAGTASLCVHPIGNPRAELPAEHGGAPGVCVPPAPRLAALYRLLCEETAAERARAPEPDAFSFEPSFEATHHGPVLTQSAAAFVEIGSDATQWARADAGAVWARTLARALGLGACAEEAPCWSALGDAARAASTVVLVLGGGHYMPAAGDVAKAGTDGRLFIGHMLASYALDFTPRTTPELRADAAAIDVGMHAAPPSWQAAVDSAVHATRAAFPGAGELCALVPKKAFSAPDRAQLADYLARTHGVCAVFSKRDVISAHRGRVGRGEAAGGASAAAPSAATGE
ncbi:hypothetical protein KFE25_006638 [Diacronema lutheri]|uniref:D-aminoacyl-tRNA deacylase n=1 Tax=Diacronema lutheri TaxID=2081491 RepID=A0A8J6CDY4_DIALT|nr:hypothetical protein KFE25_006638 [Diacronema lutheri]